MPDFLTRRDGTWHFVRHSTKVRIREDRNGRRASRIADKMNGELEAFWRASVEGPAREQLARYDATRQFARTLGLEYVENEQLVRLPIERILERLERLSVWPLRRETVDKPVISFVAEAYDRQAELPRTACSSIVETAAEKLVALIWRAGSELAGVRKERDPTLVRHIYDLHMIRDLYDAAETAALALEVMKADVQTRGDRFPAWQKDPLGETLRAIEGIPKDKVFVDGYADFQRDMVYGDGPNFDTAMASLNALANHLKKLPT